MIRLVVFDLDGTLVDSFEDIAAAANFALTDLGLAPLSTSEIKSHVGRGLENLLRGLLPLERLGEVARALELTKAYYAKHPADFSTVYPGGEAVLENLGRLGVVRGVLSNKADLLVQAIVASLNLENLLEEVWGHRTPFPLKPDPASLLDILDRRGLVPDQCLVVGDGLPDMELAANAGAQFLAVNYGIVTRGQWEDQGVMDSVDSLNAVGEWIESRLEPVEGQSDRK